MTINVIVLLIYLSIQLMSLLLFFAFFMKLIVKIELFKIQNWN